MSEKKSKERSFVQVTLDREEEIKTAADQALKKLWELNAKIFGERPEDPSEDEKEKHDNSFQSNIVDLQKQTISTLGHLNNLVATLNEEFDS